MRTSWLLSLIIATTAFSVALGQGEKEFPSVKFVSKGMLLDPDTLVEYEGVLVPAEHDHKAFNRLMLSRFDPQVASRFTPTVGQVQRIEKKIKKRYLRACETHVDDRYKPPVKGAENSLDSQWKAYNQMKDGCELEADKLARYNRQYVGYINEAGKKCILVNFVVKPQDGDSLYLGEETYAFWKKEYVESDEVWLYLGFQMFYDVKKDRLSITAFHDEDYYSR